MSLSINSAFKFLRAFQPAFECKNRYLLLQGGRGSGKSRFIVMKTIVRMLTEDNANFLIVRKTMPALRRSIWKAFQSSLIEYNVRSVAKVEINKTEFTIRLNNNEAMFVAVDEPDKLKSIENITAGVVMEEALEFSYDDYVSLDTVLRSVGGDYKQLAMLYNPDRKSAFVHKEFFDAVHPDTYVHVSTIDDNPFIRDTYKPILESINDPEKRKSWLLGQWATFGNLILTNYEILDFDIDEIVKKSTLIAGIDWGFNDPSVFLLIAIYDSEIWVIDEIYITKTQTDVFCGMISELLADYNISEGDVTVYPENAEPDRNEILSQKTSMFISPIKKDKRQEIATLREHKIIVHPNCENTIKELTSWQYLTDRDGNVMDKPSDGYDHAMDALCYAARNYFVGNNATPVFVKI